MVKTSCSALHCLSSSKSNKDLKFHQFPHDAERRKIWIEACKRTDVIDKEWDYFKHKHVCSLHFQKCMYSKKGLLKKSAVPSLHLSKKPLQSHSSTQTLEATKWPSTNLTKDEVNETFQTRSDISIIAVTSLQEKQSMTCYTQTEDIKCIPYVHKEVKTEREDDGSHSKNDDIEIKDEVETSKTPHAYYDEFVSYVRHNIETEKEIEREKITQTQSKDFSDSHFPLETQIKQEAEKGEVCFSPFQELECVSSGKELKEKGTCYLQIEDSLQEIDQKTNLCEKSVIFNPTNVTNRLPIKTVDKAIQTDDVYICIPKKEIDNEEYIENISLPQFLRCCAKFLPPELCLVIENQVLEQTFGASSRMSDCDAVAKPGISDCAGMAPK